MKTDVNQNKYDLYYEKTKDTELGRRETLSFIGGGVGNSLLYGVVTVFLMIYSTDVFGLPALAVGTIFFISRFTDAITDPIAGIIVDQTRTAQGKFRPYLIRSSIFWVILTILLFNGPNLSVMGKFIYMLVIYLLWGLAFTFFDIPYWSFSTVLTQDEGKKNRLVSIARSSTLIGMVALMTVGGPLVAIIERFSPGRGYSNLAIIVGVLALILMQIMSFTCKERIKSKSEHLTLKETIKQTVTYLKINRPLQLTLLTAMIGVGMPLAQGFAIYFVVNNLGSIAYMTYISIPSLLIIPLMPMIIPFLLKRFERKHVFYASSLAQVCTLLILFFVGYDSLLFVFIMNGLSRLFNVTNAVMIPMLITDAIDYGEWKTGNRFEAISFSLQSFTSKTQSAINGLLIGIFLTVIQYDATLTTQTPETLRGIFLCFTLVPALVTLLAIIPLLFHKFSGKVREDAMAELKEMRKG